MIVLNYQSKIDEIKRLISRWLKRQLTTLGKITVIKTIMLPKLTHLFKSLPAPSTDILRDLEKLYFGFIWNFKPDRIARKVIIQDFSRGGLRMIHLVSFIKSLKLTWIRRILTEHSSWTQLLFDICPTPLNILQSLAAIIVNLYHWLQVILFGRKCFLLYMILG